MSLRPTKHESMLRQALLMASDRGTCPRRQVGCLLVDVYGHIIGTGYNGAPRGASHCIDNPCPGAELASGTGLSVCEAVHAEMNALVQCKDTMAIDIVYCTDSPCIDCVKVLLNTSARTIIFAREYPHEESRLRWKRAGRSWLHLPVYHTLEHVVGTPFVDTSKLP